MHWHCSVDYCVKLSLVALISQGKGFCLIHLGKYASWRRATNRCKKFKFWNFWKCPLFMKSGSMPLTKIINISPKSGISPTNLEEFSHLKPQKLVLCRRYIFYVILDWKIVLNVNLANASLYMYMYMLSVLRFGLKKGFLVKKSALSMLYRECREGFLLFRINLDLLIQNPLNEIMLTVEQYVILDKNAYFW